MQGRRFPGGSFTRFVSAVAGSLMFATIVSFALGGDASRGAASARSDDATNLPAQAPSTTTTSTTLVQSGSASTKAATSDMTTTTASKATTNRADAALALIDYPWQRTGYTIVFAGSRAGILGLTSSADKTITIYVRSGQSVAGIARVIAHELGHAVDLALTTDAERARYREIRGLGAVDWFPCDGCSDYASPAGDFAETFAYWLLGPGDFRSTIASEPTAEQLSDLAAIFAPNGSNSGGSRSATTSQQPASATTTTGPRAAPPSRQPPPQRRAA